MAVASAGPYASLHLAPDRQPHQHPTTPFFTGRMPFPPPNQQCQSTEGSTPHYYYASAVVAVESSHMNASSPTLWSRFSPPSDFVNGHEWTMWFMVTMVTSITNHYCRRHTMCEEHKTSNQHANKHATCK